MTIRKKPMPQPIETRTTSPSNGAKSLGHVVALEPIRISLPGVTAREAEVVGWVAQGLTNKSIALQLRISARTVQKHLERMFRKLGIRSRSELVARAYLTMNEQYKTR
jgi:DNA-binding CsgD family transcriptional regulator